MVNKPPLRVGLWQAVSTKAQTVEGKAEWEKQEADGRMWAEASGGRVVELFIVPGHSRRRYSLEKLAAEAERKQITAFTQLLAHFERPQIDVLWTRGGDRFARTQSLFARIVEELIDAGVAIYSQQDDLLIHSMKQARQWISTEGARVAADVDRLVDYRHNGMTEFMKRGLPTNSTPPRTHLVRRNPITGRAEALVVNRDTRQMYHDAAALLLEGVAYRRLEKELLARYGHARPDGSPYPVSYLWDVFTNPITWGNVARFHTRRHGESRNRYRVAGEWVFEEGFPLPDGVEIAYAVCEPLFDGLLAEQVKAEMRRRWQTAKGSGLRSSKALSGLVYCDACQRPMAYTNSRRTAYLRCFSHWRHAEDQNCPDCDQRITIREDALIAWFSDELTAALKKVKQSVFALAIREPDVRREPLADLQAQVDALTLQIQRLINAQKTAPEDLFLDYQDQIAALAQQRRLAWQKMAHERHAAARSQQSHDQARTLLADIRQRGVESLWKQPPMEINQTLHILLEDRVIFVRDGKIVRRGVRPPN